MGPTKKVPVVVGGEELIFGIYMAKFKFLPRIIKDGNQDPNSPSELIRLFNLFLSFGDQIRHPVILVLQETVAGKV